MSLVLCSACTRHVRNTEPACPFCGAAITNRAPRRVRPVAGTSRAAILAISSTVWVACGNAEEPRDEDTSGDERSGSDPMDGSGRGTAGPQPGDEGTVVALYGAPAPEE